MLDIIEGRLLREMSIAADHGLPKQEVRDMLRYFGFDLSRPIEERRNSISIKYFQPIERSGGYV